MPDERNASVSMLDMTRRYVRQVNRRCDGFVEFEFSIAEQAISVDLILPEAAYRQFCRINNVIFIDGSPAPTAGLASEKD